MQFRLPEDEVRMCGVPHACRCGVPEAEGAYAIASDAGKRRFDCPWHVSGCESDRDTNGERANGSEAQEGMLYEHVHGELDVEPREEDVVERPLRRADPNPEVRGWSGLLRGGVERHRDRVGQALPAGLFLAEAASSEWRELVEPGPPVVLRRPPAALDEPFVLEAVPPTWSPRRSSRPRSSASPIWAWKPSTSSMW